MAIAPSVSTKSILKFPLDNLMKSNLLKFLTSENFDYSAVIFIAVAVFLPVFYYGLPWSIDFLHHYQCAYSFYEGIVSGDFYPSWSAARNLGFGGMELRLYPPLSHYTLAVFYAFFHNWHIAACVTLTFYSILGSLGVFIWARELMPSKQAAFAGCGFAFLPYHLSQIYGTFFFAEYVGTSLLPFSFLFVYRVAKRGRLIDIAGLAAAFALLILSHLPLTVIGSVSCAIYGLSLLERRQLFSQTVKLSVGVIIGLAASSFFWIKVLLEKDLMARTTIYPDLWLDYRLHFLLTPIQTYAAGMATNVYEYATSLYDWTLFCAAGLVAVCAVPFVISTRGKLEKNFKGIWLVFAISVFLTLPFSKFLWDNVTVLQDLQFPWRWLSVVSVTAPVLAAGKLDFLFAALKTKKRPLALIAAGFVFATAVFSVTYLMGRALYVPTDITEITIKSVQTAKGLPFWWTKWARFEFLENTNKITAANRNFNIENWQPDAKEFQISQGDAQNVRIAVFYHPNWHALVNGFPVETMPDSGGAVLIPVTAAESTVNLFFEEEKSVESAQKISVVGWIFIFLVLFNHLARKTLSFINKQS